VQTGNEVLQLATGYTVIRRCTGDAIVECNHEQIITLSLKMVHGEACLASCAVRCQRLMLSSKPFMHQGRFMHVRQPTQRLISPSQRAYTAQVRLKQVDECFVDGRLPSRCTR
jgi:hypothetical protein